MRYTTTPTNTRDQFNDGVRPELEKLPKGLAALLRERDRIMAQRSAAQTRVAHLGTAEIEEAAAQTDDDAASKAARAGKDIPPAIALPQLEAERAEAARAFEAQEAAFDAITGECEALVSKLYWDDVENRSAKRAQIRADIAAQANALADAVEAAVDAFSVSDWMRTGSYDRSAQTWPTEVVDLRRHGLTRDLTTPTRVRDVLVAAATTVLEDPAN